MKKMNIKKVILAVVSACLAAFCFASCESAGGGSSSTGIVSYGYQMAELNGMLRADYSRVTLTVTDRWEAVSLTSKYYFTDNEDGTVKVVYSVERFAEIGDWNALPEESKTVVNGEAVFKDGEVVEGEWNAPEGVGSGLEFNQDYFTNLSVAGTYLKADVKNPSGFLGAQIECGGMHVEATFLSVFFNIDITFTAKTGNFVEYKYEFTV